MFPDSIRAKTTDKVLHNFRTNENGNWHCFKNILPEGITVWRSYRTPTACFHFGCRGKTPEEMSCPPLQTGSNAPDLITCSNKHISPCWHWVVYEDVQEPESWAVVSNHIHSCSVHFRRTIIFITSLSSSLRHRTWQHLGLAHCLYVSVFKKKIVFFQYKYLGLARHLFA